MNLLRKWAIFYRVFSPSSSLPFSVKELQPPPTGALGPHPSWLLLSFFRPEQQFPKFPSQGLITCIWVAIHLRQSNIPWVSDPICKYALSYSVWTLTEELLMRTMRRSWTSVAAAATWHGASWKTVAVLQRNITLRKWCLVRLVCRVLQGCSSL